MRTIALLALWLGACSSGPDRDWRTARRSSAAIACLPTECPEAIVQVYTARAFRWRGVFAVHSWIAFKRAGAASYEVADVVGFRARRGQEVVSVRPDLPDRRWYGAEPTLLQELRGEEAERAIDSVLSAVDTYAYPDEYLVYPGPNSNTFVSHVLRSVPELTVELPPHAVGRDWQPPDSFLAVTESGTGRQLSLLGLATASVGLAEGIEVGFLGLTFGIDLLSPALKLPLVGRVGFPDRGL